ncbi:M4 family metallopeptidase [Paludibacterium purpuratum]|uniref:Neutral metalloproteinase n=1 Tax=Paludibacterium purpuratum TaxID=1144873 RepID=A0A4R7AXM1_9NEIS|nr:M4 family metallopeptidase [Paludibacterium purpuratum]TDR72456.1 pseudolysin/vibriolysin [Paludibacterium purpuratum]
MKRLPICLVLAAGPLLQPAFAANLVDIKTVMRQGIAASAGLPADFKAVRSQSFPGGKVITRYQQYYQGIPIWSQAVIGVRNPSIASNGDSNRYDGKMVTGIKEDLSSAKPTLSSAQALTLAKGLKAAGKPVINEKAQLLVQLDRRNAARLIYQVSYFVPSAHPTRPNFLIDANSGAVLSQWDGLAHLDATGPGGNKKTGKYEFGTKYGYLPVSANCDMDNGKVVATDLQSSEDTSTNTPFHFTCPRNTADRTVNGAYGAINDAYYFGNAVVKMYKEWLGLSPLNGPLYLHVHYGSRYENAFWDGSSMNFGDGASRFYPLVSVDVTGHEISHGFTEQNSGLVYDGQSGGINEAYSDIAGEATEFYVKGKNTWLIGQDITKGTKPLRYMEHPAKDGRSIEKAGDYQDGMDPHRSSGVFNRAFFLLAQSKGWSVRQAFQVFADANRLYWNQNSDYNQASCGVIRAARERGYDSNAAVSAFADVGVTCKQ